MMMKSSPKWLTMSWLAEFLVGLLWSNLPLMTCYLRSCLSSMGKNFFGSPPAVKLVWKSEFSEKHLSSPQFCWGALKLRPSAQFMALPPFFGGVQRPTIFFYWSFSHTSSWSYTKSPKEIITNFSQLFYFATTHWGKIIFFVHKTLFRIHSKIFWYFESKSWFYDWKFKYFI